MAGCWDPPSPIRWKIFLTVAGSGTCAAVDAVAAGAALAGGGGIRDDSDCGGRESPGSAAVGSTGCVAGLSMSTIMKPLMKLYPTPGFHLSIMPKFFYVDFLCGQS